MIDRRAFIIVFGGSIVAAPLVAPAQQGKKVYQIVGVAVTYMITLDGAPLAALSVGQHVIWRTAPRDLIVGMKSRDGVHLTQALRAEPGGSYYFRTSPRGLDRTTEAEGRALVGLSTPGAVQLD